MRTRIRSSARSRKRCAFAALAAFALACGAADAPSDSRGPEPPATAAARADARERAAVAIAGRVFDLEVALDPATRMQGLSGRREIDEYAGMLFVLPNEQSFQLVMRDCPAPIGAAFLDSRGVVLAVAEMKVEAPRRPDESPRAYEARLPRYGVEAGARMAVELRGGRLSELGIAAGAQIVVPDLEALLRRAK